MQVLVYNRPGQLILPRPAKRATRDSGLHADKREPTTSRRSISGQLAGIGDAVARDELPSVDSVLVTRVSACGLCGPCRKGMYMECTIRARMLARRSRGLQAKVVGMAHADANPAPAPAHSIAYDEALVMLSDLLPQGLEFNHLDGKISAGSRIAIVGSGPVELAALLTAQIHAPAEIIMIDTDERRLAVGKRFGATATVNSSGRAAVEQVMHLTSGRGVDTVIEVQGTPATLQLCEDIVAPGGAIAQVRVHCCSEVHQQLERLWSLLDRLVLGTIAVETGRCIGPTAARAA